MVIKFEHRFRDVSFTNFWNEYNTCPKTLDGGVSSSSVFAFFFFFYSFSFSASSRDLFRLIFAGPKVRGKERRVAGVIMKMILYLCSQGDRPQTIAITRNETAGSSHGQPRERERERERKRTRTKGNWRRFTCVGQGDLKRKRDARTTQPRCSIACK